MGTRARVGCALLLGAALAEPAGAHGVWGHVHVTGWAVENMPDDDLRAFLLEPEVFNALLFGAAFTDSGYASPGDASRAYSEHTHWEPFVEDFVAWIRANDPPPWDELASRKRVAFLLGCASHGLQDSLFDSLFLFHVEEHDGAGQSEADPGTDGFLVVDQHVRFVPEQDMPMETLLALYGGLEPDVTEDVIRGAVDLMTSIYVNDEGGLDIAVGLAAIHEDALGWTRTHYLNQDIPGSLRAEIFPTMRYQQAVWARLHGDLAADEATVFAFPESPRRLLTHDPASAGSWGSLVFGAGLRYEDGLLELRSADGTPVPFTQANTRWGAAWTRVVRWMPDEPLEPGGWYTARLRPGASLIDGQTTTSAFEHAFQVACDAASAADCADLGAPPEASIDGIPDDPPAGEDAADEGGCGCGGAGGGGGPALAIVALLLVRRRRREGDRP